MDLLEEVRTEIAEIVESHLQPLRGLAESMLSSSLDYQRETRSWMSWKYNRKGLPYRTQSELDRMHEM